MRSQTTKKKKNYFLKLIKYLRNEVSTLGSLYRAIDVL